MQFSARIYRDWVAEAILTGWLRMGYAAAKIWSRSAALVSTLVSYTNVSCDPRGNNQEL
jgi:hypothetical protein